MYAPKTNTGCHTAYNVQGCKMKSRGMLCGGARQVLPSTIRAIQTCFELPRFEHEYRKVFWMFYTVIYHPQIWVVQTCLHGSDGVGPPRSCKTLFFVPFFGPVWGFDLYNVILPFGEKFGWRLVTMWQYATPISRRFKSVLNGSDFRERMTGEREGEIRDVQNTFKLPRLVLGHQVIRTLFSPKFFSSFGEYNIASSVA